MDLSIPFPSPMQSKDFIFGVATAAFQIEGMAEKRLPCIWDTFCAQPGNISDGSNGDTACDHYNLWEEDLEIISTLNVDAYRFSISWPRVIQRDGELNQEGVNFYIQLLDRLAEMNIKAFVTLYHWDLPQHLEDQGGWLNRETAYKFRDYVDKITKVFGDRVYSYATLNEPFCSAYLGYEVGIHAPGIKGLASGRQAAHHLLLAHGLAMQVLRKNSPNSENGLVLNMSPTYPLTDCPEDEYAARLADDMLSQWYTRPVLTGSYPDAIDKLPTDAKPLIIDGDMEIISQPLDFLGLNYYTRSIIFADAESGYTETIPEGVPTTEMGWEIYPQGLTDLLVSLKQRYANLPPIYITENGAATKDEIVNGEILDIERINYFQSHLNATHNAMIKGVDIRGYFAWSLMDNFEWALGYEKRFGITYVNYETQKRTLKSSGHAFANLVASRI
jgi:beta-glucosidase